MRTIRYSRFGGPEVLELHEVAMPEPGPGQVRLRVAGAGVNPIDCKTRAGLGFVAQTLGSPFAFVPGYDLAGTVDALGEGVQSLQPGDAVFGMVNFPVSAGVYAEYALAMAAGLVTAPTQMPLAETAGLPLAGLTAWQALFTLGRLQAGERLLVLAGAGGVGHLATQLAQGKGAIVSATASAANRDFLLQHGVAEALDYADPAWANAGPWDLILDLMGGVVGMQALASLAPGGRMVTVPTNTAAQLVQQGADQGKTVLPVRVCPDAGQLRQLAAQVDKGTLHLHVSARFPLADAVAAHRQIETGHTRGKIILLP
jgi:NADPH2:quinone reductase